MHACGFTDETRYGCIDTGACVSTVYKIDFITCYSKSEIVPEERHCVVGFPRLQALHRRRGQKENIWASGLPPEHAPSRTLLHTATTYQGNKQPVGPIGDNIAQVQPLSELIFNTTTDPHR
eukprot:m.513980 g.513980  ORF g.513980 m.513980 type:complete len:121 (-) comp21911_c1_seq3:2432-2794(-)